MSVLPECLFGVGAQSHDLERLNHQDQVKECEEDDVEFFEP